MVNKGRFLCIIIQWFWLIVIVVGCISLGFFLAATDQKSKDFAEIIAISALSGGLFSAVLKSFQFNGIFEQTLDTLMYKREYLDTLKDERLIEIWNNTTSALFNAAYHDVAEKLKNKIVATYIPHEKIDNLFYYKNVEHDITLSWHSQDCQLLTVVDEMVILLIANNEGVIKFTNNFRYKKTDKTNDDVHAVKWLIFKNGAWEAMEVKRPEGGDSEMLNEESPDKERSGYQAILKGETEYKIKRIVNKIVDLNNDNLLKTYYKPIVDGVTLTVNNKCNDLKLELSAAGLTKKFTPMAGDNHHTLKKKYEDVIFPRQGYMLSLYIQR